MQAALECGTKWMCLKDCFRLKGTLGQFFCQTIYEAEGMRLHHGENMCSLIFIEIWDEPGKNGQVSYDVQTHLRNWNIR